MTNPYNYHQNPYHNPHHLKNMVLSAVEPFIQYGLKEGKLTSYVHAFREVAAISYLMGMGYEPRTAHRMVESWEINEMFYPQERNQV